MNDGYGDQDDPLTLESYLDEREWLLRRKAQGDEDAVQEARIAVWKTLARHPEATRAYLDRAATWRVGQHLRGDSQTGENRGGHAPGDRPDPLRQPHRTIDDPDVPLPAVLAISDNAEALALAYHHGEIMRALAELPPDHRAYVVLRFWGEQDRTEIGRALRRNPGNLSTTWRTQIQPALAVRLAHLSHIDS